MRILKDLEEQNQKKCDKDIGGCEAVGIPFRTLCNSPGVFTVLVAWEENVTGEDIQMTLKSMDSEVRWSWIIMV